MPTYGITLFCLSFSRGLPPALMTRFWLITCLGTFLLTSLIPLVLIFLQIKQGKVHDWYITHSQERTVPYLYTIFGFGLWSYALFCLFPTLRFLFWIAIGATLSLVIVTIVNHWWKISAHLCGIGGLIGGICSYSLFYGIWPIQTLIILLCVSLLLMYARLYEDAHTPLQVVVGYLLGLLCTFLPNLILYHV